MYKFHTFALSYVGPSAPVQVLFSTCATSLMIVAMLVCYAVAFAKIRKISAAVHTEQQTRAS